MSYNGSGVYTLPGAQLVNGEIVSATENNQFRNDVATALNTAWTRDGQSTATGNIPMGTHKFTGLAAGTTNGDSVRYEQTTLKTGATGSSALPSGTTAQRDGSPAAGYTRFNTDTNTEEYYNGTSWVTVSDSATAVTLTGTQTLTNKTLTSPVINGTGVNFSDGSIQNTAATGFGFKNRIINGAMMIDQRNAGASGTATGYNIDRWIYSASQASKGTWQQNAGAVTPPTSFTKYWGFTSSSAYTVGASEYFALLQAIEGLNVSDFGWGTANATAITVSFWVRSSLTGTFGGVVANSAFNRCYPYTYTISAANTWEQKTITIAGDTTGTWLTDNGVGLQLYFNLGAGATVSGTAGAWSGTTYRSATGATSVVGTNGATFYITGVQLEKGSTATSFDYRPYGTELALCQRYYETGSFYIQAANSTGGVIGSNVYYKATKRSSPTVTTSSVNSGGAFNVNTVPADYTQAMTFYAIGGSANGQVYGNFQSSAEL